MIIRDNPTESRIDELQQAGPIVYLRDRGSSLDSETRRSLEGDIQRLTEEKPSYIGQQAVWDSPDAIRNTEDVKRDYGNDSWYADEIKPDSQDGQKETLIGVETSINDTPTPRIEHDSSCTKCNNGIVIPERVGPERMREINRTVAQQTSRIRSTINNPNEQRRAIEQAKADAYKCEGQ